MQRLSKEQSEYIVDIIDEMAYRLGESPTAKDLKELIEFLQENGYEEKENSKKMLNDLSTPFEVSAIPFNKENNDIITQVKGFNTELLNKGTLIKVIQHIRMGITPDLNGYYIISKSYTDKLVCIKKDDLKEYEFYIKDFTHTYPSGTTELSLEKVELN